MEDFSFLQNFSPLVAPLLLGCELERRINGELLRVRIVEVEAYDQADMASHSYRGRTPRNEVMFGPAGHLYVYFTYGMHYCMNVVTGSDGHGAGLLIRAIEPLIGIETIRDNRNHKPDRELTNGPGKVTQALGVNREMAGHDLRRAPLKLIVRSPLPRDQIVQTTRVGISRAKDAAWRFFIKDNKWVSKPNKI
ncbi:MAG: DNA-3-methyladenine glycosylase [Candidatus Saccharimonadales bacterium]